MIHATPTIYENLNSMNQPSPTLTVVCLITTKDFLLQMLAILPAKFRGGASTGVFLDFSSPLIALSAIVPIFILSGHTNFGRSGIYHKTETTQILALIAINVAAVGLTIASLSQTNHARPMLAIINVNLSLICLFLIWNNRQRLYKGIPKI